MARRAVGELQKKGRKRRAGNAGAAKTMEGGVRMKNAARRVRPAADVRVRVPGTVGASGQMAVEFAVIAPVMAAIAFILLNVLVFVGDCTAFDIAARDAIRMQADDGREEQNGSQVCARIEQRLGMEYESVQVTCEKTGAGHVRYSASASFSPPFLEGVSVFGIDVPALRHEVEFTVSPYRKGVLV